MSRITNRDTALARLLDSASLPQLVPHLPPETLHQLIRDRGLEACGELVVSATPAQLTSLLDLDLWRPTQPGHDSQFDVDRFGEWVEVLIDTGESVAARTIAALDVDVVVAGLSRYIRVFDPGIFEPVAQSDDEASVRHESMLEGGGDSIECEVGGYIVRARRSDAWDAIIALLIALETEHPSHFQALMHGCRSLSNSDPEESAMNDLLLAPEQHLHDVAIAREQRQAQRGYATAADARAFLEMARQPKREGAGTINPIVAAYFQAVDSNGGESRVGLELRAPGDAAEFARARELAFLANVLLAGCSVQSRPFTPEEASEAAAAICKLGTPGDFLEGEGFSPRLSLITAFEAGWSRLYQDVRLFAEQVITTLGGIETIELLDTSAWVAARGLLGECPVIPDALTAILEGRTTPVDQTAFEFISTAAQIGEIRRFMRKLPDLLSC